MLISTIAKDEIPATVYIFSYRVKVLSYINKKRYLNFMKHAHGAKKILCRQQMTIGNNYIP